MGAFVEAVWAATSVFVAFTVLRSIHYQRQGSYALAMKEKQYWNGALASTGQEELTRAATKVKEEADEYIKNVHGSMEHQPVEQVKDVLSQGAMESSENSDIMGGLTSGDKLKEKAASLQQDAADASKAAVEGVSDAASSAKRTVRDGVQHEVQQTAENAESYKEGLSNKAKEAKDYVKGQMEETTDAAKDGAASWTGSVKDAMSDVGGRGKETVHAKYKRVEDAGRAAAEKARATSASARERAAAAYDQASNAAKTAADTVQEAGASVYERGADAVGGVQDVVDEVGKRLYDGGASAVGAAKETVTDTAKRAYDGGASTVESAQELTEKAGKKVGEGGAAASENAKGTYEEMWVAMSEALDKVMRAASDAAGKVGEYMAQSREDALKQAGQTKEAAAESAEAKAAEVQDVSASLFGGGHAASDDGVGQSPADVGTKLIDDRAKDATGGQYDTAENNAQSVLGKVSSTVRRAVDAMRRSEKDIEKNMQDTMEYAQGIPKKLEKKLGREEL